MSVMIEPFSENLKRSFANEKKRLGCILGKNTLIEHVGSSAVGIGGKNIIDILIGVNERKDIPPTVQLLTENGYFVGKNNRCDYVFMASRQEETKAGDYHLHICPAGEKVYEDFLLLRNYLRVHPDEARAYFEVKKTFAKQAKGDRKTYKKLKSEYVSRLLRKIG